MMYWGWGYLHKTKPVKINLRKQWRFLRRRTTRLPTQRLRIPPRLEHRHCSCCGSSNLHHHQDFGKRCTAIVHFLGGGAAGAAVREQDHAGGNESYRRGGEGQKIWPGEG
jgi:hypothetical protein